MSSDKRSISMDEALKVLYDHGYELRKQVTGPEHVERSTANVSEFARPMQDLATQLGWGAVWSRPDLDKKQRSMLNLAMLTALGKSHELGVHVRGAIRNGVTVLEIRETLLHASVYAGMPAGLEAFRAAERVLREMEEKEGFRVDF